MRMMEPVEAAQLEERVLKLSRDGFSKELEQLLLRETEPNILLAVNCKGTHKSNLGWSPLHLGSYFGHYHVVDLLLRFGADVNVVNLLGDTPLHKAAFTGRKELVLLLLKENADVSIVNAEGKTAKNITLDREIQELIEAAEQADRIKKQELLFWAVIDGNMELLGRLFTERSPPNINACDSFGNSCLHCASYRDHKQVAVFLLQNGVDPSIKNNRGQTAYDVATTVQMRHLLDVKPVRALQKSTTRFEGPLLKRHRFLGWRPFWVVLERGVISYFQTRADACVSYNRKDFKYLDGARIDTKHEDVRMLSIRFSDNSFHRLCCPHNVPQLPHVNKQKWCSAIQEHIDYSNHYIQQSALLDDSDEEDAVDIKPLGTLKDSLGTAKAHHLLLMQRLDSISGISAAIKAEPCRYASTQAILQKLIDVADLSKNMISSLGHCLTIYQQQEESHILQLRQKDEKIRVLEEALSILAKEHHELERSISDYGGSVPYYQPMEPVNASRLRRRYFDTSEDEFYDAFDASDSDDTLVTAFGDITPILAGTPSSSNSEDEITLTPCSTPTLSLKSHSDVSAILNGKRRPFNSMEMDEQFNHTKGADYIQHNLLDLSDHGSEGPLGNPCNGKWRSRLPVPMFSRNDFNVWSILKQCIGKELSKITMPVIFNEPLSFLQRLTEYMEYGHLLQKAGEESDPVRRIEYVAAFAVSGLACNWERVCKPFNPLLGETYELERDGYRIVCEQVSHHPPMSAFHANSDNYKFYGTIHPKLRFMGKSVEIQPKGTLTVELTKFNEVYTWTNVSCCVHNIIVGKLWIEQYGTMEITNHSTGHKCILNFKPASWFSKQLHRIEGYVYSPQKNKLRFVYGRWTDILRTTDIKSYEEYQKVSKFKDCDSKGKLSGVSPASTPRKMFSKLNSITTSVGGSIRHTLTLDKSPNADVDTSTTCDPDKVEAEECPKLSSTISLDVPDSFTLWEADPRPPYSPEYYHFTLFTMCLNEMQNEDRGKLCPSDCRLRPDMRHLEEGDIDNAAKEKNRLEEKQRESRKSRKRKKCNDWTPRWYVQGPHPVMKQETWLFTGSYWDRNFADVPDIF